MRVIRVYNNNVVATRTDDKEAIVQGSGVGFGKKPGDLIDEAKIEKIFFIDLIAENLLISPHKCLRHHEKMA